MTTLARRINRVTEYLTVIDLGALILTAMAITHGAVSVLFGAGLIASQLRGANDSPSYARYLAHLPGWPISMGILFVLLGVIILYARLRRTEKSGLSAAAFLVLSLTGLVYGTLFLAGSRETNGLLGPQSLYFGLALVYFFHCINSVAVWLKERQERDSFISSIHVNGDG